MVFAKCHNIVYSAKKRRHRRKKRDDDVHEKEENESWKKSINDNENNNNNITDCIVDNKRWKLNHIKLREKKIEKAHLLISHKIGIHIEKKI